MQTGELGRHLVAKGALVVRGVLVSACSIGAAMACSEPHDASVFHARAEEARDTPTLETFVVDASVTSSTSGEPAASAAALDKSVAADAGPGPSESCPEIRLSFDKLPAMGEEVVTIDAQGERGPYPIQVEVLQYAEPGSVEQWSWPTDGAEHEPPPEEWDRADIPAGACVIRLLNMASTCYRTASGSLLTALPPDSGGTRGIGWTSYHELLRERPEWCDVEPGCQSGKLDAPLPWFYLREHGPDVYFVWCSHSCLPNDSTVLGLSGSLSAACD